MPKTSSKAKEVCQEPTWRLSETERSFFPYQLTVGKITLTICGEGGEWMMEHWGPDVPLLTVWRECNVPMWMLYMVRELACASRNMDHIMDHIVAEIYWIRDELGVIWADSEPREDFADALRMIFPEEYIRLLLGVK